MMNQLLRYWLAMNAAGIKAAAHAGKTFFGVAGAHAMSEAIPALNVQQFAAVLLLAFGTEIFNYLDANPLPVSADDDLRATIAEFGKGPATPDGSTKPLLPALPPV